MVSWGYMPLSQQSLHEPVQGREEGGVGGQKSQDWEIHRGPAQRSEHAGWESVEGLELAGPREGREGGSNGSGAPEPQYPGGKPLFVRFHSRIYFSFFSFKDTVGNWRRNKLGERTVEWWEVGKADVHSVCGRWCLGPACQWAGESAVLPHSVVQNWTA